MTPQAAYRRARLLNEIANVHDLAHADVRQSEGRIAKAGGFADAPTPLIADNLHACATRARAVFAHHRLRSLIERAGYHALAGSALALLLLLGCGQCFAEVLDPPLIDGWRYTHRAYHVAAGALLDVVTIEGLRVIAPEWTHRHPVGAQLIAGLVVGTAATCKEVIDRSRGPESLHHSLGDIGFTELGGVAAGIGFTYTFRF